MRDISLEKLIGESWKLSARGKKGCRHSCLKGAGRQSADLKKPERLLVKKVSRCEGGNFDTILIKFSLGMSYRW